jgi:glycosyltransferase involved in cell wall biosynthesis
VDGPDPSIGRIFYGGINAYLQQRSALFRHTPRFLDWLLNRPGLLRLASRNAVETRPERLGAMTVSVLRGREGRQAKELEGLVRFLETGPRPDVITLTNSLLSGVVPALRARLGAPVVCALQGEESFVERLGEPFRTQAADLLRRHAALVDRFIAPSVGYADEMATFLGVDRARIDVIRTGLDLETYAPDDPPPTHPFRVGFLSRLSPVKGIDVLVEAFRALARARSEPLVLAVAGQALGPGRTLWKQLLGTLHRDGLSDRVEYVGAVDLEEKIRFLRRCHVFSVPSRYPERRAVAAVEAMACGVPVVLPRRKGYDELLDLTGGGVGVQPDDTDALARGIGRLLADRTEAERLRGLARAGAVRYFSADEMVERTERVYEEVVEAGT